MVILIQFNLTYANNVKIDYDFEKNYNCEFLKTLIKNKEFNYKTFNTDRN